MSIEEQSEFEGKWGDKSVRAKSKYMAEMISFLCLILLVGGLVVGYYHMIDTRERDKNFLETLKDRDKDLKDMMKESNQTQREMVQAQREQNCLLAIPQDARIERANLCRSLGR